MDDGDLRAAIVAAGARLGARGLISAGEGNISVRLPDGRLLITPTGRRKDELRAEDLVVVDIDGARAAADPKTEGPRPSSDVAIHRAVLLARPDVAAVVHAHLPASMALTLAGEVPDPASLPETALLLPRLPFVPFGAPGSADLAARIAAAFTDGEVP
ncbi:MAG TPA: class II aldolase/adducin family protein, partial [Candidatus Limnocylindrales bacterium]